MKLKEKKALYRLREIASILRSEGGCAWDKKQTHESLKPYLIEESYELCDAIDSGEPEHIREELGDLLYQVYAHSRIAEEKGYFTIEDVAGDISDKLVNRHPHVFENDGDNLTAEEVTNRWEMIKKSEKKNRESILDGVPRALPALLMSYRIQQKVSRAGFDWERTEDVIAKLDEEISEFKEALEKGERSEIVDEAGDMLFVLVNILRYFEINAEDALSGANRKFIKRFRFIEKRAAADNRKLEDMTLKEMDAIWDQAKTQGL